MILNRYAETDKTNKISIVASSFCVFVFMMFGCFIIYLVNPYDVSWHLKYSFHRLWVQLWPSILFTCFMIGRTAEEALSEVKAEQPMESKQTCYLL